MDEISKKNESFVNDGILMLSLMNDIIVHEKNLEYLIKEYNDGTSPESGPIFTEYQKIYDARIKLNDIVSSINMHGWNVHYEHSDLADIIMSTTKNCAISDVTIQKTIQLSDVIPAFTLKLTNLGLDPIGLDDELILTLTNNSIDEEVSIYVPIQTPLTDIASEAIIAIDNMPCPQISYEYELNVKIRNKSSDFVFGEYKQRGINIIEKTTELEVDTE